MYKLINTKLGTQVINRLSDNAFIPMDEANSDYAEFLRWCSEGNEPLPPDEGESN